MMTMIKSLVFCYFALQQLYPFIPLSLLKVGSASSYNQNAEPIFGSIGMLSVYLLAKCKVLHSLVC